MRATRRPRVVLPDSVRLIPRGEEPRVAGRGESAEAARDARVARPPPRGGDPFRVARRELPRDQREPREAVARRDESGRVAVARGFEKADARAVLVRRRRGGGRRRGRRHERVLPAARARALLTTCSDSRRRWPTCASSLRASGEVSRRCWRCAATAATTTTRTSRTRCRAISCTNTSTRAPARFDRWR